MVLQGFESYAPADEKYREQLDRHLAPLKGRIDFDVWHGRRVLAGDEREPVLASWQQGARIQLLLISSDYFGSPDCERELERALALHEAGQARVLPIIVRPVNWEDSPIAGFQVLPRGGRPVTSWENADEAWLDVVLGIRAVLDEELARQQTASTQPEVASRQAPADPIRSLVEGLPRAAKHDVENFLLHYLGRGGRGGQLFRGRGAELEAMDHWLDDPDAPQCLFVTGPGGRGKSALLAHWVHRVCTREGLGVAYFPISVRFGTNRAGLLYQSLAARLSWLCGEPFQTEQDTPAAILRDVISNLLSQPARGRRLLVVIDALDEAAEQELNTSLFPVVLPEGVRVVLSARPRPGERISWLRQLKWEQSRRARTLELDRLGLPGVADALAQLPPALEPIRRHPGFAEALFRLSEGDPLVLWLYLDWLEAHPGIREPEQLPTEEPGLDGYFQCWLEEQRELWGTQAPEQEARAQRLLDLLACAMGPLTRQELLLLLKGETGHSLDTTLKWLSRLVIGEDKRGYALTHPGLGDYFQRKLSDAERRQYEEDFLNWGGQTVQALQSGKLKPENVPSYLVRYYAAHLERSGAEPEAFLQLVSNTWRRASEAREQKIELFLEDVTRAWHAVRRRNEERVKAGEVPFLADELRCAAVRTSIHSLASNLTPFLISALVTNGLWSVEVALAHARHEPEPNIRCLGLLGLARLASEPLRSEILEEVIDTAPAIENRYGREARVIQELASQLSPTRMERAIARIEALPNEEEAALTLATLARHAPEWAQRTLVPRVLALARSLGPYEREDVLMELSSKLIEAHGGGATERPSFGGTVTTAWDTRHFLSLASDEDLPAVREKALAWLEMSWEWHVAVEMPDLPGSLSPETLRALMTRVRATCSDTACATAIEVLASRLEGSLLDEAVSMAWRMDSPPVRSKLLAVLSSRFPPPRRNELLLEALEIARSLAIGGGVARRLGGLVSPLSESRKNEVLVEAWKSIQRLPQGRGRLLKLASLVGALPRPEREAAFEEVLRGAAAASSLSIWVDVIKRLGPAAREPRLWTALERFSPLPPVTREKLLEVAGPYLPEHWLEGALDFVLEESAIPMDFLPVEKRAVLRAIAPRLPEWLQARAVQRLRTMRGGTVVECIEILGPHLAERLTEPLIVMSRGWRGDTLALLLASLFPRVPEGGQAAVLEKAFQLITEAVDFFRSDHIKALKALAPHLTETMLSKAVEVVRTLHPEFQTYCLAILAPHSPKALASLRQHALAVVRAEAQLGHPDDGDSVLAGLLPVLPAPEWEEASEFALRDAVRSEFRPWRLRTIAPHAARLPPRRLYPLLSESLATSLSSGTRSEFYDALEALAPVLHVLGGEEELVRSIQTLFEVETWWS
jgi:hypothetical protein